MTLTLFKVMATVDFSLEQMGRAGCLFSYWFMLVSARFFRHCVMCLKCGTRPCCMEIDGTEVRVEGERAEHISCIPLSCPSSPSSPSHFGLLGESALQAACSSLSLSFSLSLSLSLIVSLPSVAPSLPLALSLLLSQSYGGILRNQL